MTNLLSPLGAKASGDMVMQVFSASMENLQEKIDKQIFSAGSTDALTKLYGETSGLAAKASKLTMTDTNSVFNDRTPKSSDSNILTATAIAAFSQDTGATEATYNISVAQLAQAQENTGLEIDKDASSVVDLGTNTFNINIKGQDHELNIEVVDGDSNEAALQKIETAINEAALGVTAEVMTNSGEGTRQLTIKTDDTGAGSAFTITDVSGNAIAATEAGSVSTEALDAAFSVDGTDQNSGSNSIYLDDGMVEVKLKNVGEAVLVVAPDENKVNDAISALISEINSFIDFNKKNSEYIKEDVLSNIDSFIADHKTALESFGITQGEDGKLDIDTDKLASAVNDNPSGVKAALGDLDGLAVQIDNYASRMSTDSPLNYAKEADDISPEFTDYLYGASSGMLQQILTGSLMDTYT